MHHITSVDLFSQHITNNGMYFLMVSSCGQAKRASKTGEIVQTDGSFQGKFNEVQDVIDLRGHGAHEPIYSLLYCHLESTVLLRSSRYL